jgi:hypothetical protein
MCVEPVAVKNFEMNAILYTLLCANDLLDNPLTTTAIQKLLEMIGRVRLCPSYSFATALDSDINQTAGSGGYLNM